MKDLLGTGNAEIVDELVAVVGVSGVEACARERGHPGATGASVEVDTEPRLPRSQGAERGCENGIDIGIGFEDFAEAVFDGNGDAEIRTRGFQKMDRGRCKHTIA
jgi:hypothetical protein